MGTGIRSIIATAFASALASMLTPALGASGLSGDELAQLQAQRLRDRATVSVFQHRIAVLPAVELQMQAPDTRRGLEFRRGETTDFVPRGALRFQLSNSSSLSLRPRGGGLAMMYREQF